VGRRFVANVRRSQYRFNQGFKIACCVAVGMGVLAAISKGFSILQSVGAIGFVIAAPLTVLFYCLGRGADLLANAMAAPWRNSRRLRTVLVDAILLAFLMYMMIRASVLIRQH
jgi:hypothetical protein